MTAQRAAFPAAIMTVSPGYPWQLVLDVKFDGERPTDWPLWRIRMHVWADDFVGFSITTGHGISIEPVTLPGEQASVEIPVIRMTGAQTESLRLLKSAPLYTIDLQPPGGEVEDYFAGNISRSFSPPIERLQ